MRRAIGITLSRGSIVFDRCMRSWQELTIQHGDHAFDVLTLKSSAHGGVFHMVEDEIQHCSILALDLGRFIRVG